MPPNSTRLAVAAILVSILLLLAGTASAHEAHRAHQEGGNGHAVGSVDETARTMATSAAVTPTSCPGGQGNGCCCIKDWLAGSHQPRPAPSFSAALALPSAARAIVLALPEYRRVTARFFRNASAGPRAPPA